MGSLDDDRKDFDRWANDEGSWKMHGKDLHFAALHLREEFMGIEFPEDEEGHEAFFEAFEIEMPKVGYLNISLMLQGYAVEVFLKAFWLHQGNTVTEESGKTALPGLKRDAHDLHLIADAVGFQISDNERAVLERLSFFAKAYGRYPVTKHHQHTPLKPGKDGVPTRMEWRNEDHEIVEAVLERLKQSLN